MSNTLNEFLNHIKTIWASMTSGQKVTSSFIVVLVGAALMMLTFWVKQPDYETLFSNLSMEDASSIVENLKSNKIPYKLSNGGTQILVPQDNVYETRLNLARQNLPGHGGIGFELFDKSGLGMTDFTQKINYQRALQGELTRTIDEMDEVEHSRIHLVLPQDSIFAEKEKSATGSIILKLKPGRSISAMQVQGIIHLVASSVEGLDPNDITVVTTEGKVLSTPKDKNDLFTLGQTNLEFQHNVEMQLKNSIQTMLEEVLGPNKSVVRVSAEIDSDKVERTSEMYDGENPVIRSEQRSTESNSGATKEAGNSSKKNETLNYEINKTVEHKILVPGKIKRLYIAAFVDGKNELIKDKDGQEIKKYVSRSSQEMDEIKNIIKKAVGYNQSRGDEIEVVNVAFDYNFMQEQKGLLEKDESKNFWITLSKNAGIAVLGIVLIYFLFSSFSSGVKNAGLNLPTEYNKNRSVNQGGISMLSASNANMQNSSDTDELMSTISDFAKKNPESASKLVAGWLAESKPRSRA